MSALEEMRAKREGAAARDAGVAFHDNPYRQGPHTPEDGLYSAWEYGYTYCNADGSKREAADG